MFKDLLTSPYQSNMEVEDIMCDQGIMKTELSMDIDTESTTIIAISATRFRLAVTVLTRAVLPTVIQICYTCLRNQKVVLDNVRHQIIPTIFAFLANNISRSLSSVQRGLLFPLLLRAPITPSPSLQKDENIPEECVECVVLHEPSSAIVVDIIFIHGIHGSLQNTWKQGLWGSNKGRTINGGLERSKTSLDLNLHHLPNSSLKRSISDYSTERPNKFSKFDFASSNNYIEEASSESLEDDFSKCWPKDWLSEDYPDARIIALNYSTDPYLWRPVWVKKKNRSGIPERSTEMINHLLNLQVGQRPIIWVGHSKGGLYIKQIIVHAWERNIEEMKNLYLQSKAIMFYSVPHRGSMLADFTLPFLRRSVELLEVKRNCYFVLNLHRQFLEMLEQTNIKPEVFSFFETSLTFMSCLYLRIVAAESADPNIGEKCGVPLDHREICKPSSRNCFLYKQLVRLIEKILS